MKRFKRLIKGILISLTLVMVLNLGASLVPGINDALAPTVVYAQGEDEDAGGPSFDEKLGALKEPAKTPEDVQTASELLHDVAVAANKTHRLFAPFINFLAFKIGAFLGTDYVYQGSMGEMLQKIWVISRNLVNIFFVFILLWLALNTVFNPKFTVEEMGKKLLFFVLFLVAINFSWLGAKVILDASNVVTHAVFAIPSGISDPPTQEVQCRINGPDDRTEGPCYPSTIIFPADAGVNNPLYWEKDECEEVVKAYGGEEGADPKAAYTPEGKQNEQASEKNKKLQGRSSFCMENLDLFDYNQNTAMIYLTYGMARIQNLVTTVGSPEPGQLAVSVLMSLVIQLAYTVSLLALFLALIVRMAMLWIFVGFSPLIVLMIYFSVGEGKDPFESIKGYFSLEMFIKWAFVPAKVGAVFVVAFIMISAGQAMSKANIAFLDTLNAESGMVVKMPAITTLFGGIDNLQDFIWLLMVLAILWMGVFAVLKDMPIAGKITEMINGYGQTTARAIATLPYKAPIIPLGKGEEKISAQEALGRTLDVRRKIYEYTGERDREEAVTELENRAKKVKFSKVAEIYNSGINSQRRADDVAKLYGFSGAEEMFKKHDDKVLKAAFKGSDGFSDHGISEDTLLDALKKYSKPSKPAPKSLAERETEADQRARADLRARREAGLEPPAGAGAPGAAQATPPPAAPPAQGPAGRPSRPAGTE